MSLEGSGRLLCVLEAMKTFPLQSYELPTLTWWPFKDSKGNWKTKYIFNSTTGTHLIAHNRTAGVAVSIHMIPLFYKVAHLLLLSDASYLERRPGLQREYAKNKGSSSDTRTLLGIKYVPHRQC